MTVSRAIGPIAAFLAALAPASQAQDTLSSFFGSGAVNRLGHAVASADLNGDGFQDLVVSSPFEDSNGVDAGTIRALSGEFMITTFNGGTPVTPQVLFTVNGGAAFDNFGNSVAILGDVNNDTLPDILVGAPYDDTVAQNAGAAQILSGADGSVLNTFHGVAMNDWFGFAVAGLGDLDDDGVPDMAVSALSPNIIGGGVEYVRVISGAAGTTLYTLFANPIDDGQFGFSLAAAGDVDADGKIDLLVGERNLGTFQAGRVHVFSGGGGQLIRAHDGNAGERLGWSAAAIGDVNKDGVPDYAVGGPGFQSSAGRVRVFSGVDGALLLSHVGAADAQAGLSVSGYGDLDQDGRMDFLVGAPGDNTNGSDAGSVVLLSGNNASQLVRYDGAQANTSFGWSCSSIGDLNGDSFPDFAVGAPYDDTGAIDGGAITVFSGGCGGPIVSYGVSCAGSGGFAPTYSMFGCSEPGGSLSLRIEKALGGSQAFLLIGAFPSANPVGGGCFMNVNPLISVVGPLPLFGAGPGAGFIQLSGNLPLSASPGSAVMAAACVDPSADLGFTLTNGVQFTIVN